MTRSCPHRQLGLRSLYARGPKSGGSAFLAVAARHCLKCGRCVPSSRSCTHVDLRSLYVRGPRSGGRGFRPLKDYRYCVRCALPVPMSPDDLEFRRLVRAAPGRSLWHALRTGELERIELSRAQRAAIQDEIARRRERRTRALAPEERDLHHRIPQLARRDVIDVLETGTYHGVEVREDLLTAVERRAERLGLIHRLRSAGHPKKRPRSRA